MQHRFASAGALHDHAMGNLLIVTLWELLGDPVVGLDWVARLLGARGRVLPMAGVPMDIEATVLGIDPDDPDTLTTVRGQVALATTPGRVAGVRLVPEEPPACPQAVDAVAEADWVVLGPGSWFTSVLPHLLVPDLSAALQATRARRVRHAQPRPAGRRDRGVRTRDPPRGARRPRARPADRRRPRRPLLRG
jgi:uncharacterized cofD-like protein